MKRVIAYVFSVGLIIIGLLILFYALTVVTPKGKGALQLITNIKGQATLNGKPIGAFPLCLCQQNQIITQGDYMLTMTPDDKTLSPYTVKITINPSVQTVVEHTFLPGAFASGYVLNLQKSSSTNPQLVVTSIPIGAIVTIDGNSSGATPFQTTNITPSEHELEIDKAGFGKKTIKIRTVPNYTLTANVFLGTGADETDQSTAPGPSPTPSITPTASASASVKILSTPTGFLRVRSQPSTAGTELGEAKPGDIYPYVDEQSGWFEITFENKNGWVSGQYAQKVTTP